jgi:hypothetical protein
MSDETEWNDHDEQPGGEEPAGIDRTCEDCGAEPGEECTWSCSSRWGFEASDSE